MKAISFDDIEDCDNRIAELEAEVERLGNIVTECDGVECIKHDAIVRGAMKERDEAEARAEAAESQRDEAKSWARKFAEQRDEAEAHAERMRAALAIYAKPENWQRHKRAGRVIWNYHPYEDGFKIAQEVLAQRQLALGAAPAEIRAERLRDAVKDAVDKLNYLLCDEDLDPEKLQEASEGLLPNIVDSLRSALQSAAAPADEQGSAD